MLELRTLNYGSAREGQIKKKSGKTKIEKKKTVKSYNNQQKSGKTAFMPLLPLFCCFLPLFPYVLPL